MIERQASHLHLVVSSLDLGGRLALVTSAEDGLLSTFTGKSGAEFHAGVNELVNHFAAPDTLVVPGARHVFLDEWTTTPGFVEWLEQFRD